MTAGESDPVSEPTAAARRLALECYVGLVSQGSPQRMFLLRGSPPRANMDHQLHQANNLHL